MRVLIVGEVPFVDTLAGLCRARQHKVDLFIADELEDQAVLDRMVRAATRCQIAVESLNESAESKEWLVTGIEANLSAETPLLVNALAASATECAGWVEKPSRVVGYGLLPPITLAGLVEFAPALQSDFEMVARARRFLESVGFEVVRVPDAPALVRPRVVCTLINEAVRTLSATGVTVEEIDAAAQGGLHYPLGLLSWADVIGLDVVVGTLEALWRYWGAERYRPAPLLRQKVFADHLGKKSGRGFYRYETPASDAVS